MRTIHFVMLFLLMAFLTVPVATSAQDESPVSTNQRVDFVLVYSSLELAFDTWDQEIEPDSVQLDVYRVASGFLAGIPFHYEGNRDKLTVFEQVDEAAHQLEYRGFRDEGTGVFYFDYTVWVPSSTRTAARTGTSYQGHGVSVLEDEAWARRDARSAAFDEAVREAITQQYTERNKLLPGILDGRITWYEVSRDEVDHESGSYVFDIEAWVAFYEEQAAE